MKHEPERIYVKPEITKDDAVNILSRKRSILPVKIKKRAFPPRKIELIYLPFYFFDITLKGESCQQEVTLSLDGLLAGSVFFAKKNLSGLADTKNPVCPFVLSPSEAQKKALKEYKGLLLEHGLQTRKPLSVQKITNVQQAYYPFWVGYFRKKKAYDFTAIDGVSGEIQGVKMRKVFLRAFREISSP